MFRQCLLRNGSASQVAWIPEAFARLGKYLRLRDENGWQVQAVWGRSNGDFLTSHERGYRHEFGSIA